MSGKRTAKTTPKRMRVPSSLKRRSMGKGSKSKGSRVEGKVESLTLQTFFKT